MSEPSLGAHLFVSRGIYTHHGIYIGDDQVIHYSGLSDGLRAGPIEVIDFLSFVDGEHLGIRSYSEPKYTGEHAVQRAKSRLGEDDYDLHANNCEHFCTWVITGNRESEQVDFVEEIIDRLSVLAGAAVRVRRRLKQSGFDTTEIAKSTVSTAAATMLTGGLPILGGPAALAYKAIRSIFK